MIELDIESLDLEANGVARPEGKVVFVRGALPVNGFRPRWCGASRVSR